MFGVKFFISFVFCGFLVGAVPTLADTPARNVEKIVREAQKSCPKLNCPESTVLVVEMSASEYRGLGKETRARLKDLVVDLANDLWPDTILEGPYEHANRFRTEDIQKLTIDGELAAYRVSYSDKAWDLDTCNYDQEDPASLKDCKTGRIYESAFVDLEINRAFRDETAYAQYISDEAAAKKRRTK